MENINHNTMAEYIKSGEAITPNGELSETLKLGKSGALEVYYAPFNYVNKEARVVICGITPGMSQAKIAIQELQRQLNLGVPLNEACKLAKETASFAGVMRTNMVKMLDSVGVNGYLGIESTAELFGESRGMVHYTSALKYPVFKSGKNYSGTPSMVNNQFLRGYLDKFLASEIEQLSDNALYIPLGPKVNEALIYLSNNGVLKDEQILSGLPHPSGANAERIAYFLGQKKKSTLSSKTNSDIIDTAKDMILTKIRRMK